MVNVPATKDFIQEVRGVLKEPEIRVWCHPPGKECYYIIFQTFPVAFKFIQQNPNLAEEVPLIAINGWEMNIFAAEVVKHGPNKTARARKLR